MSSKQNSTKIISDSTAISKSKQSSKQNQNNVKQKEVAVGQTGQTPNVKQSTDSKQLVINIEESKDNTIDETEKSVSSNQSEQSNWWDSHIRDDNKKSDDFEDDEQEILKRKIANKEISGHIIHRSPKRKYTPMPSIHRLVYSHLRTKVKDNSSSTPKTTESATDKPSDGEEKEKLTTTPKLVTPQKVVSDVDVEVDHITGGIPEWMLKPKDKIQRKDRVKAGLECIEKLRKFYIYDNIRIIDTFTEDNNFTKNWMTLRNADFQQLFFIGTQHNRRTTSYRSFTINIVDQYSRKVLVIKKHWKCFLFGLLRADFECPPGVVVARMKQNRFWFERTVEFVITDPKEKKKRYIIRRMGDSTIRHEFDIINSSLESIGTIIKRFEKIDLNRVLKEEHHIRVGVPQVIPPEDKAILICTGILINIFYLRRFKTIDK